jgi:ribosome-associated protein
MISDAVQNSQQDLINAIIEGIRRKKGLEIINIDLKKFNYSECDNFIICHGTSNTQVEAIANSVEETVLGLQNEPVWHSDGYKNAQWILLDYAYVMVHIFQEPFRRLYNLESLWADGNFYYIDSGI